MGAIKSILRKFDGTVNWTVFQNSYSHIHASGQAVSSLSEADM